MQADYHDTTEDTTINDMVLVSSSWSHTLFDTGAFHSLISILFVSMLHLEYEPLDSNLSVEVPLGRHCELLYHCGLMRIEIDRR